jgi:hypothetical protein
MILQDDTPMIYGIATHAKFLTIVNIELLIVSVNPPLTVGIPSESQVSSVARPATEIQIDSKSRKCDSQQPSVS